jgi:hypothetical protein
MLDLKQILNVDLVIMQLSLRFAPQLVSVISAELAALSSAMVV